IRLVLDAVFNHISDRHPWCREHPNWLAGTFWRGFGHMPELALERADVREALFSVIEKWNAAVGVDGWRFDVAVDVGLPFLHALRERFPTQVFIGEIMSHPGGWCGPTALSGVMNYVFRDAVLGWLNGEVSDRQVQKVLAEDFMGRWDSWNMLASHDTPRLRHVLPSEAVQRLAWVLQFTLPGAPVIYYGEEIGMDGGPDPDCRRPMIWDRARWNGDLWNFIKNLIELRRNHPELRHGRLVILEAEGLVFLRATDEPHEVALVAINQHARNIRQRVFTPHPHLYHSLPLRNALAPNDTVTMDAGNVLLELRPHTAAIYLPADEMERYRFFKPRNRVASHRAA
ncbi:MAG: alpha-amylase family glycosyl hydrolase, partial [Verrucomicrobiae bacterium]|nr:alpha-amylase family glycosyl hydrolase [Verrucomicrobiae bacterium]